MKHAKCVCLDNISGGGGLQDVVQMLTSAQSCSLYPALIRVFCRVSSTIPITRDGRFHKGYAVGSLHGNL